MWLITKVLIMDITHVHYMIKDAITISNYMISTGLFSTESISTLQDQGYNHN